ncbi:hypothetical protein CRUP_016286 [Coryphaenoides rupestris]|nr:hypothetical protein CRUP_016286 [Coryphaenoides rupestris]
MFTSSVLLLLFSSTDLLTVRNLPSSKAASSLPWGELSTSHSSTWAQRRPLQEARRPASCCITCSRVGLEGGGRGFLPEAQSFLSAAVAVLERLLAAGVQEPGSEEVVGIEQPVAQQRQGQAEGQHTQSQGLRGRAGPRAPEDPEDPGDPGPAEGVHLGSSRSKLLGTWDPAVTHEEPRWTPSAGPGSPGSSGSSGGPWSRPASQALALCVLTFCLALPLLCHRLLYSYYFLRPWFLDPRSEQALQHSYRRGQESSALLAGSHGPHLPGPTLEPHLLVTVGDGQAYRGRDFHYLLQVMQQLAGRRCAQVLLCDVESSPQGNEDAALLEGRSVEEKRRRSTEEVNMFEREKRDYVFCLQKGWEILRPHNVVVLEDDARPRPDFFPVVQDLLTRRFSQQSLYIKLYHPERLQRYWNPEPYRLLEWLGLGLLASSLLLQVLPYCSSFSFTPRHLLFFSVYVMVLVELVGEALPPGAAPRVPQLYAVTPATECCTPALLYPGNASLRAARYLDGSFCVRATPKDMLLFHMARSVPGEGPTASSQPRHA